MEISSNAKLIMLGKTKVYIIPPSLISGEEYERRIRDVEAAGWEIIREIQETLSK